MIYYNLFIYVITYAKNNRVNLIDSLDWMKHTEFSMMLIKKENPSTNINISMQSGVIAIVNRLKYVIIPNVQDAQ
jgi:hypothetical protein